MTRLLRGHPPIEVELDADGTLVAIRWNGRRGVSFNPKNSSCMTPTMVKT